MSQRIACWMSDKKLQKINWAEFEDVCRQHGFTLFKLDLNKSLELQGTFCVFLHKLTDIIAAAEQADFKCASLIASIEAYARAHPSLVVLDPIANVRQLLNRYASYQRINSTNLHKYGIFTPNFCELTSPRPGDVARQLRNARVTYPFICKPSLGHGSKEAHRMCIIFNEHGLKDVQTPCVAQSFINHNAVLYKVFIVGEKHYRVERPSLKNFQPGDNETIFFDSSDISKADSRSSLTVLEPHEVAETVNKPDGAVLQRIAVTLSETFGMDLLGIDVVIENDTGKYGIVDINAYPGYDGFPNFFEALIECIKTKVNSKFESKLDKLELSYNLIENISDEKLN